MATSRSNPLRDLSQEEPRLSSAESWIVIAAWTAFAISWFLPVVRGRELFGDVDAGWKAFLLTLALVKEPDTSDAMRSLCVTGVLGNAMVALSPLILRNPHAPLGFLVLILVSLANIAWRWAAPNATFLVGYWLWFASILAISIIVLRRSRMAREAAARRRETTGPKDRRASPMA